MTSDSPPPEAKRRSLRNLVKLNRSPRVGRLAIVSHFNRKVDELAEASSFPRLAAFLPNRLWPWIWNYLKYALTPRVSFPSYSGTGLSGVYRISGSTPGAPIKIAIAGDWGTGTDEAYTIANLMCPPDKRLIPDFTIHLGDVYYVGDKAEIEEKCLGESTRAYSGVKWPHGSQGSFSLNGNHEMYANGKPYFTVFLPTLGLSSVRRGQVASYFSLETDNWRILAVDTAYNSIGLPILSQVPGLNRIPAIGGDCRLEKTLIKWLREEVKPMENLKATLLLSHHQYFTAFSDLSYSKPARQLREFFPTQEVVWIWGHEHRMAIYDKYKTDGGITAYGRCLGHGGMPVEMGQPVRRKVPLLYYDERTHYLAGTKVGVNGFVNILLDDSILRLDYRDISNKSLLVEEFTHIGKGCLSHRFIEVDQHGLTLWS